MEETKYNPKIHKRRSIRLSSFDYSSADDYFVTICTKNKECIFGEVKERKIELNRFGYIIKRNVDNIPQQYKNIRINSFIVMPNHVHLIVRILQNVGVGAQFIAPIAPRVFAQRGAMNCAPAPIAPRVFAQRGAMNCAPTLGMIIRAFKARCTHGIRSFAPNVDVWQRYGGRDRRTNATITNASSVRIGNGSTKLNILKTIRRNG